MELVPVTQTVDAFEILQVVGLAIAWFVLFLLVRDRWVGLDWSLDDDEPFMRRLGPSMFWDSALLVGGVFAATIMVVSSLFAPSAAACTGEVKDVLNAFVQRVGMIAIVSFFIVKILNKIWIGNRAGDRALAREALKKEAKDTVSDTPTVVQAPAVVVPEKD